MTEEQKSYTRREVDLFIGNVSDKFDVWDIKLTNIHDQVKSINGRVAGNLLEITSLRAWRDRLAGGLIVITMLVVPIILYVIKLWINK